MSLLYSSSDESSSSESPQSSPNTSKTLQSPNLSSTDNPEEFWNTLHFSRAFWNLPADDSSESANEQNARIIDNITLFSTSYCDIDEKPESDRTLSLFRRNPVQHRLEGRPNSERRSEIEISKRLKMGNPFDQLLLILVTLVPASAMVVGAQYIGHCPANWLVPHLVLLIGVISTIFMGYIIVNLCSTSGGKDMSCMGKIFFSLLGIFILIEIKLFFEMSVSSDASSKDYCSRSFYIYVAFFNMFTIASLILGGLVKLIRSTGQAKQSLDFPDDELGF